MAAPSFSRFLFARPPNAAQYVLDHGKRDISGLGTVASGAIDALDVAVTVERTMRRTLLPGALTDRYGLSGLRELMSDPVVIPYQPRHAVDGGYQPPDSGTVDAYGFAASRFLELAYSRDPRSDPDDPYDLSFEFIDSKRGVKPYDRGTSSCYSVRELPYSSSTTGWTDPVVTRESEYSPLTEAPFAFPMSDAVIADARALSEVYGMRPLVRDVTVPPPSGEGPGETLKEAYLERRLMLSSFTPRWMYCSDSSSGYTRVSFGGTVFRTCCALGYAARSGPMASGLASLLSKRLVPPGTYDPDSYGEAPSGMLSLGRPDDPSAGISVTWPCPYARNYWSSRGYPEARFTAGDPSAEAVSAFHCPPFPVGMYCCSSDPVAWSGVPMYPYEPMGTPREPEEGEEPEAPTYSTSCSLYRPTGALFSSMSRILDDLDTTVHAVDHVLVRGFSLQLSGSGYRRHSSGAASTEESWTMNASLSGDLVTQVGTRMTSSLVDGPGLWIGPGFPCSARMPAPEAGVEYSHSVSTDSSSSSYLRRTAFRIDSMSCGKMVPLRRSFTYRNLDGRSRTVYTGDDGTEDVVFDRDLGDRSGTVDESYAMFTPEMCRIIDTADLYFVVFSGSSSTELEFVHTKETVHTVPQEPRETEGSTVRGKGGAYRDLMVKVATLNKEDGSFDLTGFDPLAYRVDVPFGRAVTRVPYVIGGAGDPGDGAVEGTDVTSRTRTFDGNGNVTGDVTVHEVDLDHVAKSAVDVQCTAFVVVKWRFDSSDPGSPSDAG